MDIQVARTFDDLPPVVQADGEFFSLRALEQKLRDAEREIERLKNANDDIDSQPVSEWWYAERDGIHVRWSPRQLWIEFGGSLSESGFVVTESPTRGDVRRLCSELRIPIVYPDVVKA